MSWLIIEVQLPVVSDNFIFIALFCKKLLAVRAEFFFYSVTGNQSEETGFSFFRTENTAKALSLFLSAAECSAYKAIILQLKNKKKKDSFTGEEALYEPISRLYTLLMASHKVLKHQIWYLILSLW